MNCQEVQELIEEAIDNRLSEPCKRKVAQHLARCASCKALFAAEKSEHAAVFRALNDVSDIPTPTISPQVLAARLVKSVPVLTKKAGHVTVPLWLKRAAVLASLCGGAALAAWIGTTMESRLSGDNMESRHLGGDTPAIVSPKTEGEEEMKPKQLAAVMSAATALAATPAQGTSSAEATFDSFSSEFRTSAIAEASTFLSRYRSIEETDTLASFNSFEPKGLYIIFK